MILTEKEYRLYLKISVYLLYFAGIDKDIIPSKTKLHEFLDLAFEVKFKCRNTLFDNIELVDEFIKLNSINLTSEDINIILNFKKAIKSKFIIFKYLKKHTIFIEINTNKFYAVKALGEPFYEFIDDIPNLVNATILPYNNQIIYDGFIQSEGITFGPGMRKTMIADYKEALNLNKIITTF